MTQHKLGWSEAFANMDNYDLYDDWDNDWTLLHYAAAAGAVEVVRVVALERRLIDVNAHEGNACTPLRAALANSRLPRPEYADACLAAVRLLLEHGADDTLARLDEPADMPLPAAVEASVQTWFPVPDGLREMSHAHPERLPPVESDFDPPTPWAPTPLTVYIAQEGRLLDGTARSSAAATAARTWLLERWENNIASSAGPGATSDPAVGAAAVKLRAALQHLLGAWPAAAIVLHAWADALLACRRTTRLVLPFDGERHAAAARADPLVKGAAGAAGWAAVGDLVLAGAGGNAWRRRRAAVVAAEAME
jgi:hypothetical protein